MDDEKFQGCNIKHRMKLEWMLTYIMIKVE